MYIAAGQGHTTPGDKLLMSTETSCRFGHLLQVSKNLSEVWFYTIFSWFYTCIHPQGKGWQPLWDKSFMSLWSFVASFKNISLKSDFIHFFHDFIHVYYPGAEADSPQQTKFWCQTEMSSHFIHLWQVSKKCLLSMILYNFFHDLIHIYSPGAGADSPQGTKFWCQQEGLINLLICCKFQRDFFEVWFYTIFFMILFMCIAPRQGLTTPWGWNFYVNRNILPLWSFVASFKKMSMMSDFILILFMILYMYIAKGQGQTAP